MTQRLKFLVVRSRQGWAVNAGSDRLSEHSDLEEARQEAAHRAELSREAGDDADSIDLSDDDAVR
ncbi:hypothetical protein [Phenylobacterium immobile]|uniref:hypothetical protein n=1 Tax=Phenylobacterium immobile TaxID=21 RepID=UPI000A8AEAC2|nr:hypothetical protein [Phenylobacterium immobile]